MTPDDRQVFVETVLGFAELKGKQLSAPSIELYWRALQHWPLDAFRAAAEQLVRTCEFMPGPKDFEDLRKAGRPTAGEAWAAVMIAVRGGAYQQSRRPVVDELTDRAVAGIGGYHLIGMGESSKNHFLAKQFTEVFEAIQDAEDTRVAVPEIAYSGPAPRLSGPRRATALLGQIAERK